MDLRIALLLTCALGLALSDARAQTAYVTDNLRLGMHQAADTSDRPFRVLDSGQSMEVLSRDSLYALVRLPDGAQGYVKAGFLVDDKPAKLIVTETQQQLDAVTTELAETKSAFAGSAGRIAELESQVQELTASLAELRDESSKLSDENATFRGRMSLYKFSLPWPMVLGAALAAIVLGFVGGMWWIDHRSRKRHGGFRIY